MALIDCPECGRNVSNYAEICPQCSFPIREMREKLNPTPAIPSAPPPPTPSVRTAAEEEAMVSGNVLDLSALIFAVIFSPWIVIISIGITVSSHDPEQVIFGLLAIVLGAIPAVLLAFLGAHILKKHKGAIRVGIAFAGVWIAGALLGAVHDHASGPEVFAVTLIPPALYIAVLWVIHGFFAKKISNNREFFLPACKHIWSVASSRFIQVGWVWGVNAAVLVLAASAAHAFAGREDEAMGLLIVGIPAFFIIGSILGVLLGRRADKPSYLGAKSWVYWLLLFILSIFSVIGMKKMDRLAHSYTNNNYTPQSSSRNHSQKNHVREQRVSYIAAGYKKLGAHVASAHKSASILLIVPKLPSEEQWINDARVVAFKEGAGSTTVIVEEIDALTMLTSEEKDAMTQEEYGKRYHELDFTVERFNEAVESHSYGVVVSFTGFPVATQKDSKMTIWEDEIPIYLAEPFGHKVLPALIEDRYVSGVLCQKAHTINFWNEAPFSESRRFAEMWILVTKDNVKEAVTQAPMSFVRAK